MLHQLSFKVPLVRLVLLVLFILNPNPLIASESNELGFKLSNLESALKNYKSSEDALNYLFTVEQRIDSWNAADKARYYYLRGFRKEGVSDYDGAIKDYTLAIDGSNASLPDDTLVESLLDRSYVKYLKSFDTEDYCPDRKLAVEYSKNIQNKDLRAKALTQYAFCFNSSDDFQKGTKLLQQAIGLAENNDLSLNRKAMIFNATGDLYGRNFLYEFSLDYIQQAYELWSKANDYQDVFNMLHTMVGLCVNLDRWTLAEKSVAEMHYLADTQPQFKDFKFFAYFNEGRIHFFKNEFEKAEVSLKNAVNLEQTTPEKFFVDRAYTYLAISLARLNKMQEATKYIQQPMQSEEKLNKSLAHSLKAIDAIYRGEIHAGIEHLFKKAEVEKNAFQQRLNNRAIYVSLEHRATTTDFENKILENELAINQLKLNNELSKNEIVTQRLAIAFLLVFILIFISIFMYKSRRLFKHRAQTDSLTGIANRRYCFERGEKLLKRSVVKKRPFSVLIFDIDHFKKINDTYGHKIGDEAIKMVAQQAEHWLKKGDVLGRIGGEEFLVLLAGTNQIEAEHIAERLRNGIAEKTFTYLSESISLTVSIGVSSVSENNESLEQLVNVADKALYQAKNSGRNRTCLA